MAVTNKHAELPPLRVFYECPLCRGKPDRFDHDCNAVHPQCDIACQKGCPVCNGAGKIEVQQLFAIQEPVNQWVIP